MTDMLPGFEQRTVGSAFISQDGLYRYVLNRRWGSGGEVLFIGLNPSTADAEQDDPTIRRCIRFAKDWGYGTLAMANLYAYRATKPSDLHAFARTGDAVGEENDLWLVTLAQSVDLVVAAWGADPGPDVTRPAAVMDLVSNLHVLGLTAKRCPRHPLYMPAASRPQRWTYG